MFSKRKDETAGVAIEEFVGVASKMYSYFKDDNSEHKKTKGVNRKILATKSRNKYKDALLNKKCLRYSVNRIQSKDNKILPYEISKNYLSCFDDKIYIKDKGCN